MNCPDVSADLVDLARNALSGPAADRVNAHVEGCPACAARLAQERALTRALKHLADTEPDGAFDAVETRLLAAFADAHPARQAVRTAPIESRWWLAAAAALVLAAGLWGGWEWRQAHVPSPPATAAASAPAQGQPSVPPVVEGRAIQASAERVSPPPRRVAAARAARRDPLANGTRFVPLPTATGLPGLESGRVVRVEFPMSELPAYGIDIAPDTGSRVIEADVLVGQDGLPRAIRFVNQDLDSRRRQ